jgi:NADPH-dependent ferric siderophore reductase
MARTAPKHRRMITAGVVRSQRISENFLRLTVGGPELADFDYQGWDQCFRLFFPRPGQTELRMPTSSGNGWIAQYYLMPTKTKPTVRNYTVRAFRPELNELDIDFVVHGDGPAASWAAAARPGDPVGLFDEGTMYSPNLSAEWQLLAADESGLPAAAAIAEQTPGTLPTLLLAEVPADADILPIAVGGHVTVRWFPRNEPSLIPGSLLLKELLHADLPGVGRGSVLLVGESSFATGVRRHLVNTLQVPKPDITFFGYWKHGKASIG